MWTRVNVGPVLVHDGRSTGAIALVTDVTDRHLLEERLEREARFDALTGVANRTTLFEVLNRELARPDLCGVLFADLNDFKAIEGDRRTGIRSLPVQLGVQGAARTACAFMLVPQAGVVALLLAWGQTAHALGVAALMVAQVLMMRRFLRDPLARALWYSGFGVPLFVAGMMVSAFALRGLGGTP